MDNFVGKIVEKIYMSEDELYFIFRDGTSITGLVEGDCCSHSYFFDFYGVKNVLGNEIVGFEDVELSPGDVGYRKETFEVSHDPYGETQVYGYRITTLNPLFGEVSAVFSFRNDSNGYYGGWMTTKDNGNKDISPSLKEEFRLFEDKIG